MTATTETRLAPAFEAGTRVYVPGDAERGNLLGSSPVDPSLRRRVGTVVEGPDDFGNYVVRNEQTGEASRVRRTYMHAVIPQGTVVRVLDGAMNANGAGRVHPTHVGQQATVRTLPDSDGDYYLEHTGGGSWFYCNYRYVQTVESEGEGAPASASEDALREYIRDMDEKWEALNEALNERAEQEAWCGEYERAVTPLGFTGRHAGRHCYDMSVDVDVESTVSSLSSDFDDQWASEIGTGLSVSASRAVVRYEVSLTVHVCDQENSADAEQEVTAARLREELDGALDSSYEILDFTVTDAEQADEDCD